MSINDWRLYGGKKAQGVVDVSAPEPEILDEEVVEDVEEVVEEVVAPTSSDKKAEIYDYLLSQGYDEDELDGLTKAELLELV